MAKAKSGTTVQVVVTVEFLLGLQKQIEKLARKVDQLETQVQENFDSLAEHIPQTVEGGVRLKAYSEAKEGYEDVVVPVGELSAA